MLKAIKDGRENFVHVVRRGTKINNVSIDRYRIPSLQYPLSLVLFPAGTHLQIRHRSQDCAYRAHDQDEG